MIIDEGFREKYDCKVDKYFEYFVFNFFFKYIIGKFEILVGRFDWILNISVVMDRIVVILSDICVGIECLLI